MDKETKDPTWSDWEAESFGFRFESGVGLTVEPHGLGTLAGGRKWLSWNETVAFSAWLAEKVNG